MQTHQHAQDAPIQEPADPHSATLIPVLVADAPDDDPDAIFLNAVAQIDTQPLLPPPVPYTWGEVAAHLACLLLIVASIFGLVWQVLAYPKTLVLLYAVEKPASLTTTLTVSTRTLAPVTLTRSASAPTTGHGYQDALQAQGSLTFYNGLFTAQAVPIGTVFTAPNGMKIATTAPVTIPAADPTATPPQFVGFATVPAHALLAGAAGNLAADAINTTFVNGVSVKNTSPFQKGRDARDFRAVAQGDLDRLTATLQATVAQEMPSAFTLAPGESVYPTQCVSTATPDHRAGVEANVVTVHVTSTCQGKAYNSQELARRATAAFAHSRPAPRYHLIGSVQTTLVSVSPLVVTLHGMWAYTFSPEDEQDLAEHIQGDTPAQARAYLLHTGVIAQANVPHTLPPSMYIQFVVLVG